MKTIKKNEFIGEMISYRTAMTVIEAVRYPDGNAYPICPKCDTPFEYEYQAFCSYCEQKLGWNGFSRVKIREIGKSD